MIVHWNKPVRTDGMDGENVRQSKCGRFTIERRRMASARNGYWNAITYVLVRPGQKPEHFDMLRDAQDAAEDYALEEKEVD